MKNAINFGKNCVKVHSIFVENFILENFKYNKKDTSKNHNNEMKFFKDSVNKFSKSLIRTLNKNEFVDDEFRVMSIKDELLDRKNLFLATFIDSIPFIVPLNFENFDFDSIKSETELSQSINILVLSINSQIIEFAILLRSLKDKNFKFIRNLNTFEDKLYEESFMSKIIKIKLNDDNFNFNYEDLKFEKSILSNCSNDLIMTKANSNLKILKNLTDFNIINTSNRLELSKTYSFSSGYPSLLKRDYVPLYFNPLTSLLLKKSLVRIRTGLKTITKDRDKDFLRIDGTNKGFYLKSLKMLDKGYNFDSPSITVSYTTNKNEIKNFDGFVFYIFIKELFNSNHNTFLDMILSKCTKINNNDYMNSYFKVNSLINNYKISYKLDYVESTPLSIKSIDTKFKGENLSTVFYNLVNAYIYDTKDNSDYIDPKDVILKSIDSLDKENSYLNETIDMVRDAFYVYKNDDVNLNISKQKEIDIKNQFRNKINFVFKDEKYDSLRKIFIDSMESILSKNNISDTPVFTRRKVYQKSYKEKIKIENKEEAEKIEINNINNDGDISVNIKQIIDKKESLPSKEKEYTIIEDYGYTVKLSFIYNNEKHYLDEVPKRGINKEIIKRKLFINKILNSNEEFYKNIFKISFINNKTVKLKNLKEEVLTVDSYIDILNKKVDLSSLEMNISSNLTSDKELIEDLYDGLINYESLSQEDIDYLMI